MKVWITKYALTTGIQEVDGEVCSAVSASMIQYDKSCYAHGDGKDWHRTREGAVKKAKEMRTAKIAALHKQIARLEKLTFP